MATKPETEGTGIARKLLVPAAISAAGSALGFLLTKRQKVREAAPKLREAVSDLSVPGIREGGVGELTGDLRGKLDEVLGKEPAAGAGRASSPETSIDHSELARRRRERQERRNRRRQRSRR
jgi:type IV secretory pathway TrbL component